MPAQPPALPLQRPIFVWIISILYFASAAYTLVSFALIVANVLPLTPEQRAYFHAQSYAIYAANIFACVANLIGAVLLFCLRRLAFHCLALAFIASAGMTVHQMSKPHGLALSSLTLLIGAAIGWTISLAVLAYVWHLKKHRILR